MNVKQNVVGGARSLVVTGAALIALLVACKSNNIDAATTNINGKCTGAFQHCSLLDSDQCETNTDLDVLHCGACATACSTVHGKPSCNAGVCAIECAAGFADCNNDPTDGCEANLTADPLHCGSCADVCSQRNATAVCNGGKCVVTKCDTGFNDCNASGADGCESDPARDVTNCGGCGTSCVVPGATAKCNAGQCQHTCDAGHHACGSACPADSSPTQCGASCQACSAPSGGTPTCVAGACDFDCGTTTKCGASCVDTLTDKANCGACGHDCLGGSCSAGKCQPIAVTGPLFNPFALAVTAARVAYADVDGGGAPGVYVLPKAGGASAVMVAGLTKASDVRMRAAQDRVYWVMQSGTAPPDVWSGQRNKWSVGGDLYVLADGSTTPVKIDSNVTTFDVDASANRLVWVKDDYGSYCYNIAAGAFTTTTCLQVPGACGGGPANGQVCGGAANSVVYTAALDGSGVTTTNAGTPYLGSANSARVYQLITDVATRDGETYLAQCSDSQSQNGPDNIFWVWAEPRLKKATANLASTSTFATLTVTAPLTSTTMDSLAIWYTGGRVLRAGGSPDASIKLSAVVGDATSSFGFDASQKLVRFAPAAPTVTTTVFNGARPAFAFDATAIYYATQLTPRVMRLAR
jgi:hypothetical protein